MKKIKIIGLVALPLMIAVAAISPSMIRGESVSAETVTEIGTANILYNINQAEGHYKLTTDIELENAISLFSSKENPFKGTFDGNGHTIKGLKFEGATQYQGLFGYTDGAVIKNVKISYKTTTSGTEKTKDAAIKNNFSGSSDYYAGAIVGYATNGTIIEQCEVDNGNETVAVTKSKLTMGGLVGYLDNSTIKNCVTYRDIKLKQELEKGDTITLGGAIGTVANSSTVLNVANFGKIDVQRSNSLANTTYIGGFVGDLSGNGSQIINCVSAGNITDKFVATDDVLLDKDTVYSGAIAGFINAPIPQSGNIANIAYTQNIVKFGRNSGYKVKKESTQDYVLRLPESAVQLGRFYFLEVGKVYEYTLPETPDIVNTFDWHEAIGNGWGEEIWCIVVINDVNELRLQEFQEYSAAWSDPISTEYSEVLSGSKNEVTRPYGETIELTATISKEDKNFYEITDILLENVSCKDKFGDRYAGKINQASDLKDNQIVGYSYKNGSGNPGTLTIYIKASSLTAGNAGEIAYYSVVVRAKEFEGQVYIDDNKTKGATVKFGTGSERTKVFTKSQNPVSISASAGSLYTFSYWNLYDYLCEEGDIGEDGKYPKGESDPSKIKVIYTLEEKDGETIKTIGSDYLINNGSCWKVRGSLWTNENGSFVNVKEKFTFKFAEDPGKYYIGSGNTAPNSSDEPISVTDRFLFTAVFEYDPYYIKFTEDAVAKEAVTKIEINGENITNEEGKRENYAVGKNLAVKIEVYVNEEYELSTQRFIESLIENYGKEGLSDFVLASDRLDSETKTKVYTFTFSTGNLNVPSKTGDSFDPFDLVLSAKLVKTETKDTSLAWIIGGSVGGGVVLIGCIILIIFLVKRKRVGAKIKSDYKNYF